MLATTVMQAQDNQWVRPQDDTSVQQTKSKSAKQIADQKYMAGAVPEVDGRVVFTHSLTAPGKSSTEIYDRLLKRLQQMTHEEDQIKSRVAIVNPGTHEIGAAFEEWMTFKRSGLVLDRTRFYYTVHVRCGEGTADVTVNRMRYLYEEERTPQTMTAEEWITDKQALNKKKTKLLPVSAKFRRKTVDRMEELFNGLAAALQ